MEPVDTSSTQFPVSIVSEFIFRSKYLLQLVSPGTVDIVQAIIFSSMGANLGRPKSEIQILSCFTHYYQMTYLRNLFIHLYDKARIKIIFYRMSI